VKERKGEFPAQTIRNPGGHQQLKVMTVLKNGKVIGTKEITQVPPTEASTSKVSDMEEMNAPPFPQRLVKPKKEKKLLTIFEILRKVDINIPLLDAIKPIPSYAKFLKDFVLIKGSFRSMKQ
jgi:hypothetical protein